MIHTRVGGVCRHNRSPLPLNGSGQGPGAWPVRWPVDSKTNSYIKKRETTHLTGSAGTWAQAWATPKTCRDVTSKRDWTVCRGFKSEGGLISPKFVHTLHQYTTLHYIWLVGWF